MAGVPLDHHAAPDEVFGGGRQAVLHAIDDVLVDALVHRAEADAIGAGLLQHEAGCGHVRAIAPD